MNQFDREILHFLYEKKRARFTEIRDHLMDTLGLENKGSLDVRLSRRLNALKVAKYINREKMSHKMVYYSLTIPTWRRLQLENSELSYWIKGLLPSSSWETDTLVNRTAVSIMKLYLGVTSSVLFELLTECYNEGVPDEAELKQMNLLIVEVLAKMLVSIQEELNEKFEQGESLKKTFEDVDKWLYTRVQPLFIERTR